MRGKRKQSYEVLNLEDILRRSTLWIVDVALVILLALTLTYLFGGRVSVPSSSMNPTLQNGDKLLINRCKGRVMAIDRFDVAVYRLEDEDSVYLKRVLGLPGETVQILDGKVLINGEVLTDKRLNFTISSAGIAAEPIKLGTGEYFVIGENTDASLDSRFTDVGNIRLSQIVGTAWLRYAPFKNLGLIGN